MAFDRHPTNDLIRSFSNAFDLTESLNTALVRSKRKQISFSLFKLPPSPAPIRYLFKCSRDYPKFLSSEQLHYMLR